MRRKAFVAAVLVALAALSATQTGLASMQHGCTHGFWKQEQHFVFWSVRYTPDTPIEAVFANVPDELVGDTLLEALRYKGGRGVLGGARILLREAVAALLNAAYDRDHGGAWGWDGNPWWNESEIIAGVSKNLGGELRSWMIEGHEYLEDHNDSVCPLP
jgi:hypothetical protein